jgi:hypothetical protein
MDKSTDEIIAEYRAAYLAVNGFEIYVRKGRGYFYLTPKKDGAFETAHRRRDLVEYTRRLTSRMTSRARAAD